MGTFGVLCCFLFIAAVCRIQGRSATVPDGYAKESIRPDPEGGLSNVKLDDARRDLLTKDGIKAYIQKTVRDEIARITHDDHDVADVSSDVSDALGKNDRERNEQLEDLLFNTLSDKSSKRGNAYDNMDNVKESIEKKEVNIPVNAEKDSVPLEVTEKKDNAFPDKNIEREDATVPSRFVHGEYATSPEKDIKMKEDITEEAKEEESLLTLKADERNDAGTPESESDTTTNGAGEDIVTASVKDASEDVAPSKSESDESDIVTPLKSEDEAAAPLQSEGDTKEPFDGEIDAVNPLKSEDDGGAPLNEERESDAVAPAKVETFVTAPLEDESDVVIPKESQSDVVTPLKSESYAVAPVKRASDNATPLKGESDVVASVNSNSDVVAPSEIESDVVAPVKSESDIVAPLKSEFDVVTPLKRESDVVTPLKGERDVPASVKSKNDVVVLSKIESDVFAPVKSEGVDVAPLKSKSDVIAPLKSKSDVVAPVKSESDVVAPLKRKNDAVAPVKSESDVVAPVKSESDVVAPLESGSNVVAPVKSESDVLAPVKGESDVAAPVKSKSDIFAPSKIEHGVVASVRSQSDDALLKSESDVAAPLKKESDAVAPVRSESDTAHLQSESDTATPLKRESDVVSPLKSDGDDTASRTSKSDVAIPLKSESDSVVPVKFESGATHVKSGSDAVVLFDGEIDDPTNIDVTAPMKIHRYPDGPTMTNGDVDTPMSETAPVENKGNDDGDDEVEESSASTTMLKDFIRKTIRDKLQNPDVSKDDKAEDGRRSYLQDNKAKIRKFLREDFRAQEGVNDLQHKRHYIQQNSKRLKNLLRKDFEAYMEKRKDQEKEYISDQEDGDVSEGTPLGRLKQKVLESVFHILLKEGFNGEKLPDYVKKRMGYIIGIVETKLEAYLRNSFKSLKPKIIADFDRYMKHRSAGGILMERIREKIQSVLKGKNEEPSDINGYWQAEKENIKEYVTELFEKHLEDEKFLRYVKPKLIADFEYYSTHPRKEHRKDGYNDALPKKLMDKIKTRIRSFLTQNGKKPDVMNRYLNDRLANIVRFLINQFAKQPLSQISAGLESKIVGDFQRYLKNQRRENLFTAELVQEVENGIRNALMAKGYELDDVNEYLEDEMKNIKEYLFGALTDYINQNPGFMKTELISDFERYISQKENVASVEDPEMEDTRAPDRELNRKKDDHVTTIMLEEKDDASAAVEEKEKADSGTASVTNTGILVEPKEKEDNSAAEKEPVAKDIPAMKVDTDENDAAASRIESENSPSLPKEDDVDECRNRNGGCEHLCVNTGGSYHCICRTPYSLLQDGKSCGPPQADYSNGMLTRRDHPKRIQSIQRRDFAYQLHKIQADLAKAMPILIDYKRRFPIPMPADEVPQTKVARRDSDLPETMSADSDEQSDKQPSNEELDDKDLDDVPIDAHEEKMRTNHPYTNLFLDEREYGEPETA